MPSCSKPPSQNLCRNPEFFLLGRSGWSFFQSCLGCPFPEVPSPGSDTHSAPKGVYYLVCAGGSVPSCPMRQPFRVCSCLRARAWLWQWGKPRGPTSRSSCSTCSSWRWRHCLYTLFFHGSLAPTSCVRYGIFSGRQGRERACPGVEGQSRLSIKTILLVSAFLHQVLTVPNQEKSEARKMGQGTSLTQPVRIWMFPLSVFYQGHFQNFLTHRQKRRK